MWLASHVVANLVWPESKNFYIRLAWVGGERLTACVCSVTLFQQQPRARSISQASVYPSVYSRLCLGVCLPALDANIEHPTFSSSSSTLVATPFHTTNLLSNTHPAHQIQHSRALFLKPISHWSSPFSTSLHHLLPYNSIPLQSTLSSREPSVARLCSQHASLHRRSRAQSQQICLLNAFAILRLFPAALNSRPHLVFSAAAMTSKTVVPTSFRAPAFMTSRKASQPARTLSGRRP